MSVRKDGKIIAGTTVNPDLFDFKWADHILDDISWLRADTFSWQNGNFYTAMYNHLASEYNKVVLTTALTYSQNGNISDPAPRDPTGDSSGFFKWGESFYTAVKNPNVGDMGFIVSDMYVGITVETVNGDDITLSSGSPETFTRDSSYDTSGIYYWVYTYPDTPQYHLYVVSTKPTLEVGDEVILIPGNGWDHYPIVSTTKTGTTTETIGGVAVEYALVADGHKIVTPDQESVVQSIYNVTGVAWYYIIDTVNKRFKLPRTKFGFTGLRDTVGNYVDAGLPNITGIAPIQNTVGTPSGAFYKSNAINAETTYSTASDRTVLGFDASLSNSIYGNSNTVQPKATEMYLYFYAGNYTPDAVAQTAGMNVELLNDKLDINMGNVSASAATNMDRVGIRTVVETYASGSNWYRRYSDGWVEQGSDAHNRGSSNRWNFLIGMAGTYNAQITARGSQRYAWVTDMGSTYLTFNAADDSSQNNDGLYYIKVCGYAAS